MAVATSLFRSLLLVMISRCSVSGFATRVSVFRKTHQFGVATRRVRSTAVRPKFATVSSTQEEERVLKETYLKQSLSIVGDSIKPSVFGGVPYWNTSKMDEFRVCFVLGGPGAGKGTQSELMKENYPCVHLSVGELLRNEQTNTESPHAALIQECLVAGKIVPVEISLKLLQNAMEAAASENGKSLVYLVDGFPRNYDNLDGWNRCMGGVASVWGVMMYTCPLAVLEQRILSRAETSGRSDDNLQSAQKRFRTFERETLPLVDIFQQVQATQESGEGTALKVCEIQGDQTIEQVWRDTQCVMDQFIANDVWTANEELLQAVLEQDREKYESLCALEMLQEDGDSMESYEPTSSDYMAICNAKMEFVSGTKVLCSYDRTLEQETTVRETRVWSHEGPRGWINVHFSRTPANLQ